MIHIKHKNKYIQSIYLTKVFINNTKQKYKELLEQKHKFKIYGDNKIKTLFKSLEGEK